MINLINYSFESNSKEDFYNKIDNTLSKYLINGTSIVMANAHQSIVSIKDIKDALDKANIDTNKTLTLVNWSMIETTTVNRKIKNYLNTLNHICNDSPYKIIDKNKKYINLENLALFIPEYNICYLVYDAVHYESKEELELLSNITTNIANHLSESTIFLPEILNYKVIETEIVEPKKEKKDIKCFKLTTKKSPEIIDKMISMVDKERFKKLLAIAGSNADDKKMPSSEMIKKYLHIWANQKYEFFLLFGEKLSISEPIEYEIDKAEMKGLLDSLCYQFPKYAITLKSISVNEYINNTLSDNETLSKYAPKIYKAGMKVSKLFSLLFEDTVFDIELSKVLENRKIQGQIIISIDPYDYLTMSVNSHDWRSCHSIEYGDYTTGGFSYMCDETTLIAYRDNGKLYNYNILGFKFVGNSKSWRQCIYVDKESCACIFSRQYPDDIAVVADTIRHSLEACLANYIHNKNAWVKCKSVYNGSYSEESDFNYHDVEEGFEFTFIRFSNLPNPDKYINFKVGSQVFCVYCGKKLKSSGSACCGCKSNT